MGTLRTTWAKPIEDMLEFGWMMTYLGWIISHYYQSLKQKFMKIETIEWSDELDEILTLYI